MELNAHVPAGPIQEQWESDQFNMKLVSPANKRRFEVIVVGSGLAGASAAASLAELGYHVTVFLTTTRRAGRTRSRRRVASTPRRTIRTTATACTASSTTP